MDIDILRKLGREVGLEYLESDIRPGALATSETLNRFRRTIDESVSSLADDVREYGEQVRLMGSWLSSMSAWMLGFVSSAIDQLNSYQSGWEYRLADTFREQGWEFSDPSMHDQVFGQITPPVSAHRSVINPKKLVYVSFANTRPTPVARGDMEIDLTVTMSSNQWLYPTVLPDSGMEWLWVYCPLDPSYDSANNLSIALLPWGGVLIDQIWTMSGGNWSMVYQTSSQLAAGRFWWDTRATGKPQAIGVILRKLQPQPVALVHFSPNATTFREQGEVKFYTHLAFGQMFSIREYRILTGFPSSGAQFSVSVSGTGNSVLNITVRRLAPNVPTVVMGAELRRA